ncbi:hypothetical protein BKA61DRAFT_670249 [Leptodontidium sp. MPI-SDFR-AT-0119]|nr:hypothetical protein BKA61DRAFT_670249 [Leptodontidium sp. MPI-SDFR-AT-0119]
MFNDAWHEAMEIAAAVRGNVNFNSEKAETEFLGRPTWNQKYQKYVRAVLDNAATFQLAYRWNWRAWEVIVRCDDWLNVCINGGHTVLHELFHLDSLSKVATAGHISDRKIRYKDSKNDTGYRRAYGPEDVKLLASWANSEVGKYEVTNADNLAQYSLAKWVQKKTGLYSRHPARDRSRIPQDPPDSLQVDEVAASPEVVDPLDDSLVEPPETCDDVDAAGNCNETDNEPVNIDVVVPLAVPVETDTPVDSNEPLFELHDYENEP